MPEKFAYAKECVYSTYRITKALKSELERYCLTIGKPKQEIVTEAIKQYLKSKGYNPPEA